MAENLPFTVKSANGRQSCSRCRKVIKKEQLQLALVVQSEKKDEKEQKWHCFDCFFKVASPSSENQINNFANLDNKKQNQIRKQIAKSCDSRNGKKSVKRAAASSQEPTSHSATDDFAVNCAQTTKHVCKYCFQLIQEGSIKVMKVIHEIDPTDVNAVWYHLACFKRNSHKLGWHEPVSELPGFTSLEPQDQKKLKQKKGSNDENNNAPPLKKMKLGTLNDVNEIIGRKVAKQNQELHDLRDNLEKDFKRQELVEILRFNKQFVPQDKEELLMHVADVIYFGALNPCEFCKNGKFVFGNSSYKCHGNVSRFAKCNNTLREPMRSTAKIPKKLEETHNFLKEDRLCVRIRAIKIIPSNVLINTGTPLKNMEFGIEISLPKTYNEIKAAIERLGGTVTYFMSKNTAAVISKARETHLDEENMKFKIKMAKQLGLQVVPEAFIERVKTEDPLDLIKEMNLSPWNCVDPAKRISRNGAPVGKSDSFYEDKAPKILRPSDDGVPVDVECDLENVHVLWHDDVGKYCTASMTLVDIVDNKNSFCRIQILESEDCQNYWLFEIKGRISTTRTEIKKEHYSYEERAVYAFEDRFEELTGNGFGVEFENFIKKPGKFQLMDIVYDKQKKVLEQLVETKLKAPVYDVMKLICDEKAMKETMLSFNLDTDAPMGKIGKKQIKVAQHVLNKLSALVEANASETQFIEASNQFYTMIPHKFIQKPPTIINTAEMIRSKSEMLDRLREIDFTYSLLNEINGEKNPLDSLYRKLNTDITPLDIKADICEQIKTYVQQTHHENYHDYLIEVQDIFEVVRNGEEERYRPFKTLHNRQLLWHGSALTNFVGIFSNGLCLAPADVQINGKAFGNGLYFADAIAKSSRYCTVTRDKDALLLLCEVALGDMHELQLFDQTLTSAPNGKHSVKGLGRRYSRSLTTLPDGVQIPFGRARLDKTSTNQLEFNEYIVYNEAQVKIRYLVRVKFKAHPGTGSQSSFFDDYHDSECNCSECAAGNDITDSQITRLVDCAMVDDEDDNNDSQDDANNNYDDDSDTDTVTVVISDDE